MSNFDPNAVIRGAQLTVVGAVKGLRNPELFKYEHYQQAFIAVAAGVAIRLLVAIPITLLKSFLWVVATVAWSRDASRVDRLVSGLDFIATSVVQVPFFLMILMRYVTPTLDDLFMDSLRWVDYTYAEKHKSDDRRTLRAMYYPNLRLYRSYGDAGAGAGGGSGGGGDSKPHASKKDPLGLPLAFLQRFGRRAAISLVVYLLSFVPVVGRFVLPAASFWAFNKAVGPLPALAIFGAGIFLPRRFLVVFLQSYFSSRSLMRELLEPYFSRIRFTKEQKRRWFRDREGLLFGFAVGFYLLLRVPFLGVLAYGVAEAATAYLITKITDPPPPPSSAHSAGFAESQTRWRNKAEFLRLPLDRLDVINVALIKMEQQQRLRDRAPPSPAASEPAGLAFDKRQ